MRPRRAVSLLIAACVLAGASVSKNVLACSTFMLAKGPHLVFGHNLNENGIDVPGMVFVNKRGVFKTGRTWSEIINKDRSNPSAFTWISRYGSVTFNAFGRDFPDGGVNESGLYIWEMNEDADFPKNMNLPKLNQMHWMQYNLDIHSSIDQVIESAYGIEIDGWTWHFFVADSRGKSATIAFVDGDVVVHRDERMPVPALFNEPYDRELELLRYFEGFGGSYPVELDNMNTPRFAKAAVMLRDFNPDEDPVEYGFLILKNLTVAETPKWSVLIDLPSQTVYFKTRLNAEIKRFSMNELDFSNLTPAQILNMDISSGGDVRTQFHSYDDAEFFSFLMDLPLPDEFFTVGGLTRSEFCDRATHHWHAAERPEIQLFAGSWVEVETKPGEPAADQRWIVTLATEGSSVSGEISRPSSGIVDVPMDHLKMVGDRLVFTFRKSKPSGEIFEVRAEVHGDRMFARLFGMEDDYGVISLTRMN